jgi:putative peptidoglycan lipid II flippase
MFRSIFTNTFGILSSRILGFIRDMYMASTLGANIFSDIFFVAFKLPNLFRRIFAEGAFSQTFIPAFTKSSNKAVFTVRILFVFSVFLMLMTLLVQLFSEQATFLIAFGFDDATRALAAPFVAINFYYLILIFWVTFLTALLHYKHHFATSAFSTALLNISLITALFLSQGKAPETIVTFLSYGVVVGGVLQLLIHLLSIYRLGLHKLLWGGVRYFNSKKPSTDSSFSRFKKNFAPAVWGNSTAQLAAFIDTALATFLVTGSISYLYYANRVFQLPLALFAIATSLVLFPRITRAIKNSDETKATLQLTKGFWFLFPLLTLSTIGGIVLSEEIVWLLFEHGAFTKADRVTTANVLMIYLLGLLPFGIAKLFSLWLYAKEQQKKAALIASYSLGGNIILSLALIAPFQIYGLVVASTASGFITLFLTLKAFGFKAFLAIIATKKSLYLLIASLITLAISFGIKELFSAYL